MLEIKPLQHWIVGILLIAIIITFLLNYLSGGLLFFNLVLALIIIQLFLYSKSKIILNGGKLIYSSVFKEKEMAVENIDKIKLLAGFRKLILLFVGKRNEADRSEVLQMDVAIYNKNDLKNLLNQIKKINPDIAVGKQATYLMEGKSYMITGFEDE